MVAMETKGGLSPQRRDEMMDVGGVTGGGGGKEGEGDEGEGEGGMEKEVASVEPAEEKVPLPAVLLNMCM